MANIKFGTDGWRAVVGKDFTEENVLIATRAIAKYIDELQGFSLDDNTVEEIEIIEKYEGYIVKQKREAENHIKLEEMKIPDDFDFMHMDGLRLEARQKLAKFRPATIGQASRVSGVNPSDVSILILNVRKKHA